MFFIPGILISAITFPGVIIHELAHQIFCRIMRVPVYEVKYFQFSNPCGYVLHESTENPFKTFMISIGPFLVNTLVGMIIISPAAIELIAFEDYSNPLNIVLGWLGFSILMHAFPSTGDAKVLVNNIFKNKNVNTLVKILVAPIIGLIYIGALGSVVWLDAIYAILVAMIIPNLFLLF
ncbi:MAG: metalloprotease family protein [Aminipila sp.]